MPTPRTSDCPEQETLAALIGGQLLLDQHPDVEAHLAECSACQNLVAAAACALEDTEDRPAETGVSLPRPGEMLASKYRIEGVLGRGAMGTVFAARHGELGQLVAIKVLQSALPEAAPRFLREAKISAQLRSEHTARVFDFGRTEVGTPFIVMEHLSGEDLARVLRRGTLSPGLVVEYAVQICSALSEAHAAGVVHRDLKPSNLFVTRRLDGSVCIKVLDFGISKRLSEVASEESHALTQEHSILGSPAYMSPEQIKESKDVDARTDIWSLGVVLYELSTGRRPFNAQSLSALSAAIAADEPAPPSSENPAVPVALDRAVMRCLNKDPSARFATALELAAALRPAPTSFVSKALRARGWALGALLALTTVWILVPLSERERTNEVLTSVRREPLTPAVSPPPLSIECDLALPAAQTRISILRAGDAAKLQRSWPLERFCDRTSNVGQEFASTFGAVPLSVRAELEPPLPFHRVEVAWSASERAVRIERTAEQRVTLELLGSGCEQIGAVSVSAQGLPVNANAAKRPGASSCQHVVQLPFEAFGRKLGFELDRSSYVALGVPFDGNTLAVTIRRKPARSERPKPCIPPEYCRL